jgi:hypothetical protein
VADDDPKPEGDASGESDPTSESVPDESQSLSDTEADIEEFLGSDESKGENRLTLDVRQRKHGR